MITPAMPRNISFRVDTMFVRKANKVGRLRCDENGIYKGLPMMVLGKATQQQTYYDTASMMNQITNPDLRFNKVFTQGKLYGEYGHPSFIGNGYNDAEKIERLMTVVESNTSHLFTSLYTDPASPDGSVILRGDIKPAGPMGPVLKESLEDPVMNTAFSLRAYVSTEVKPNGIKYRTVRSLATFDTVNASGFRESDKQHALGLEAFGSDSFADFEITVLTDGNLVIDQIALEAFTDTEMNEIFGTNTIGRLVQSRTYVKADQSLMERFPTLYPKSVFNEYFKG